MNPKLLFAAIRPAHAVHLSEEQAEERLREIHRLLDDQNPQPGRTPLKWHERNRLEQERLDIKRTLEAARRKSAGNRVAVTVDADASPCGGGRIVRRSEVVTKRDSKGRPQVIMEYRDHRPLSPEEVARAVERKVGSLISKEIEGLRAGVAQNQSRIDALGLTPTVLAENQGTPGFAPMRFAHEAPSGVDGQ